MIWEDMLFSARMDGVGTFLPLAIEVMVGQTDFLDDPSSLQPTDTSRLTLVCNQKDHIWV